MNLPDGEVAVHMSAMYDLMITSLEEAGAFLHGKGNMGRSGGGLLGFRLGYTSPGEEGMVWARSFDEEGDQSTVLVLFYSVER